MRDYYRILNVSHTATAEEIQRSYRALARRHHPDRNPGPGAAAEMTRINEAYRWLNDPDRRSMYDRKFVAAEPEAVRSAALDAARDLLRSSCPQWSELGGGDALIRSGPSPVAVGFVGLLGMVELDQVRRRLDRIVAGRLAGGMVSIAYRVLVGEEIEASASPFPGLAAVDLVHARMYGFVPPEIRAFFEPFLLD